MESFHPGNPGLVVSMVVRRDCIALERLVGRAGRLAISFGRMIDRAGSSASPEPGHRAGLLLCMAYGALMDAQKLAAEINLAIEG